MFGNDPFLLVGEYRGNPGTLNFFLDGVCVLSIRINVSVDNEIGHGEDPVIKGDSALAHALGKATGLMVDGNSERSIRVSDRIEFIERGSSYIALTILAIRGEGVA